MYVIYLVLWQVFNLKHHLVSNNQYISCQTIHIHVYFIRSWKHVMFSSFCNSILCYFIQSESSLKRYFWDNPCEVNQQFFPCPISSDHLKEKCTDVKLIILPTTDANILIVFLEVQWYSLWLYCAINLIRCKFQIQIVAPCPISRPT